MWEVKYMSGKEYFLYYVWVVMIYMAFLFYLQM